MSTAGMILGPGLGMALAMAAAPFVMMDLIPMLTRGAARQTITGAQGVQITPGGFIEQGNTNIGNLAAQAGLREGPSRPIPVNVLELPPAARSETKAAIRELAGLQATAQKGDAKLDSTMQRVHQAVLIKNRIEDAARAQAQAAEAHASALAKMSRLIRVDNRLSVSIPIQVRASGAGTTVLKGVSLYSGKTVPI